MKIKIFVLFLVVFSYTNNNYAQDILSNAVQLDISTAALKNTVVIIGNQSFDYRVLKYYTEFELRAMPEIKRNQILVIATRSYRVIDMALCPTLKESEIDISKIEALRKENSTSSVLYGNDCKVSIELISRIELKALLNTIK